MTVEQLILVEAFVTDIFALKMVYVIRTMTIEQLKLVGGFIGGILALILVCIAVLEFYQHNEQDRETALFNSMQAVVQGNGTAQLRQDIDALLKPLLSDSQYEQKYSHAYKPEEVQRFINYIYTDYKWIHLKHAIAYLETMYEYGKTDLCSWKIVSTAYSRDAGLIVYFFEPILLNKPYANIQQIHVNDLYHLAYNEPPVFENNENKECQRQSLGQILCNAIALPLVCD